MNLSNVFSSRNLLCYCHKPDLPKTPDIVNISPVATPICSIVNLVAVRSVLFFDMEVIIWVYRYFLAWLPERLLWGTLVI